MNYKEKNYDLEKRKVNELIKRLKQIEDWNEIEEGNVKIFHKNSKDIYCYDYFEQNIDNNTIEIYFGDSYCNAIKSNADWYYYDENIANEVNEEFNPKLWWYKIEYESIIGKSGLIIAINEKELHQKLNDLLNRNYTFREFRKEVWYQCIKEIDGYKIELK